jgi:hypothetical protein
LRGGAASGKGDAGAEDRYYNAIMRKHSCSYSAHPGQAARRSLFNTGSEVLVLGACLNVLPAFPWKVFHILPASSSWFGVRCSVPRVVAFRASTSRSARSRRENTYLSVGGYASSLLVKDFQDKITVHWRGRLELVARRGEDSRAVMELSSRAAAGMYDAACFTNTR